LSSGLTALQGTVASLQTAINAIEIPAATDVSGLATAANLATLSTALTTLAADVKELQDTLATAATAAEVAALQTALTAAQADLTNLLAQGNIYSTKVTIKSKAELDFAVALGDKLTIINEEVDIEQKADMDATVLQTVMNKIKTVVKDVTFVSTATGITTTPSFDNLTSAANVTLTQKADVSLPALVTTGALTITDDNKVTSVSAPKLEVITSLGVTSHNKVTSYSMPALKRFPAGNFTLTVDSGTVDFSAVVTTEDTVLAAERADTIEIDGATIVKAPLIVSGKLLMEDVVEPNFPVWKGTADSKFDKAKKVVLPSMTGAFIINLNTLAPKATYFHYIGLDGDDKSTTGDDKTYKFPSFTTTGNTVVETLIVGGHSTSVFVKGATDLTSFTITGGTHALTLDDNDSMSSYVLGHTSTITNNSYGAISSGSLTIKNNSDITSVTADSLDDINTMTITDNGSLETLSFAALNSLGTDTDKTALAAGEGNVNIYDNALAASKIQLPSEFGELPVVKGKITTDSGLDKISTWIGLAVAKRGTADTDVELDKVNTIIDKSGVAVTASVGSPATVGIPNAAAAGISTTNRTTWSGEDTSVYIINLDGGTPGAAEIKQTYQRSTYGLDATGTFETDDFISIQPNGTSVAKVTFSAAFKQKYGITNTFNTTDLDTWATAAESELNSQLDAGAYNFTVEIEKDFGIKKTYLLDLYLDGVLSETAGRAGASGVLTFTYGTTVLTQTVLEDTDEGIHEALARAINASSLSDSFAVATVTGGVQVTPEVDNVRNYEATASDFLTFGFANNYDKTGTDSATSFLGASMTIAKSGESLDQGYRLTVINDSKTLKANLLDYVGATTSHTTKSGTVVLTELVEGTNFSGTDNNLQRDWANVTAGVAAGAATGTSAVNLTTWF